MRDWIVTPDDAAYFSKINTDIFKFSVDRPNLYKVSSLWDTRLTSVSTDELEIPVQHIEEHDKIIRYLGKTFDALVDITLAKGQSLTVTVYSTISREYATDIIQRIKDRTKIADSFEKQQIRVYFWYTRKDNAEFKFRTLPVPTYNEIKQNYSSIVAEQLSKVMKLSMPPAGGKLILWSGDPGTGKTFAIRALGWEARKWAQIHYITDPAEMLSDSNYIMSVLTDSYDSEDDDNEPWTHPPRATGNTNPNLCKLLVLEDAGELLAKDAKERTGQGFSKLLNIVDGFLGQGTRVIVLVTTNENLGTLHPAITRAGRCISNIEFTPLNRDESEAWLRSHGSILQPSRPMSIADLYATLEERVMPQKDISVGFGRR